MLGQFGLLPLLKGWEYKEHIIYRTLTTSEIAEKRISEMGWLLQVALITTDCYGTIGFRYQGADLELHEAEMSPQAGLIWSWMPDASGYIVKYFRPNPNSTGGVYTLVWNLGGYYGSAFPYVPTIILRARLDALSTQAQAEIWTYAATIAITDKEAYLKSLRLALESKADLGIDMALLSVGPAELGKSEKKVSK